MTSIKNFWVWSRFCVSVFFSTFGIEKFRAEESLKFSSKRDCVRKSHQNGNHSILSISNKIPINYFSVSYFDHFNVFRPTYLLSTWMGFRKQKTKFIIRTLFAFLSENLINNDKLCVKCTLVQRSNLGCYLSLVFVLVSVFQC